MTKTSSQKARAKASKNAKKGGAPNAQNQNPQKTKGSKSQKSSSGGGMAASAAAYFKTLTDPFNSEGLRLGWGCMVPSNVTTLYVRGQTPANADGTIALACYPNATGLVSVANGGTAVSFATSATKAAAIDQSAVTANFSSGRVISMGIKAIPSIALTSAPGASYSGAANGNNFTNMEALTPSDLISMPTSIQGIGYRGGRAYARPQDDNAFIFNKSVVDGTGYTGTVPFPTSIPYVAFVGLPANAVVLFEAVVNIEVLSLTQHSAAAIGMTRSIGESLASHWPSFEKLWQNVQPRLPPSGHPCLEYGDDSGSMSLSGLGTSSGRKKGGSMMNFPSSVRQIGF